MIPEYEISKCPEHKIWKNRKHICQWKNTQKILCEDL